MSPNPSPSATSSIAWPAVLSRPRAAAAGLSHALRRTARRDRLIGLFVLGVVLFNPPILNLFGGTIFGWPALFVYLFAAWAVVIAGVAFVVERRPHGHLR